VPEKGKAKEKCVLQKKGGRKKNRKGSAERDIGHKEADVQQMW